MCLNAKVVGSGRLEAGATLAPPSRRRGRQDACGTGMLGISLSVSVLLLFATVTTRRSWAASPSTRVAAKFAETQSRVENIRKIMAEKPTIAKDSYLRLGLAVADRFRGPVPGGPAGKEDEWARLQSDEVSQVVDWTVQRIDELLHGARPVVVPRPVGGPLAVRDGLLIAPTRTADSPEVTRRPYWFSGYMNYAASAYNTTTNMLPEWREFGVTLLSVAPSLAFVGPGWAQLDNLEKLPEVLRKAAVAPHIMPDWAIKDAPEVMSSTPATFIAYNIDHPKAREVIERWLRMYVPVVKDSPALFGFYLSNEPLYLHSGRDQYSRPLWIEWLKKYHSTVGALNTLYKTNYGSFDLVPVPPISMPDGIEARRAYYDWHCFNDQHFADWHGWMNGIIKSIAPHALTHVKALRVLDMGTDKAYGAGIPDPELLSDVTDLADSDAWPTVPAHEGPDAYWWRSQSFMYDLLHSFRGQPVCDSENHPINVPSGPRPIPPAQTRAAIWQGALHHRVAVALFVWENWTTSDCQGQIFFRPANIYAAGRAMLDMNRLSEELAAINQAKVKVALLYSKPSVFWERDYSKTLRSVYTALTFMGQPVTFVSERQLASGKFSSANAKVDWIILPRATHVRSAAVAGLEEFVRRGGHVVMVGPDCLGWDEYHRPVQLPAALRGATRIEAQRDERAMMAALRPVLASGGLEMVRLTGSRVPSDCWGVEYRVVHDGSDLLVPITSYNEQAEVVRLHLPGQAVDLLSGKNVDPGCIALGPMEPRLLRIRRWSVESRGASDEANQ